MPRPYLTARQRLAIVRAAFTQLRRNYPEPLTGADLFQPMARASRQRLAAHLRDAGYLEVSGYHGHTQLFVANIEKITAALADEALLADLAWPEKKPRETELAEAPTSVSFEDGDPAPASPDGALRPDTTPADAPNLSESLQPPPPMANMDAPPPGAAPDVVQAWIFTLLHAQTENLIYIRERLDQAFAILKTFES